MVFHRPHPFPFFIDYDKSRATSDGRVLAIDGRKPGTAPAKPAGGEAPFF